jgi:hypothetical protein
LYAHASYDHASYDHASVFDHGPDPLGDVFDCERLGQYLQSGCKTAVADHAVFDVAGDEEQLEDLPPALQIDSRLDRIQVFKTRGGWRETACDGFRLQRSQALSPFWTKRFSHKAWIGA